MQLRSPRGWRNSDCGGSVRVRNNPFELFRRTVGDTVQLQPEGLMVRGRPGGSAADLARRHGIHAPPAESIMQMPMCDTDPINFAAAGRPPVRVYRLVRSLAFQFSFEPTLSESTGWMEGYAAEGGGLASAGCGARHQLVLKIPEWPLKL